MSKVVVITGAGSGLGRTLALHLAGHGERVVLLGRTPSKIEAVAAEIGQRATAITCDVASPESVRVAFAAIAKSEGKIDALVNNAAVYTPSRIEDASEDLIVQTVSTNLTGAILCSRAAIPLLRRGGQIINISSESVELPFAHLALYQATKAGLERFTISLADELEDRGLRASYLRAGKMTGAGAQPPEAEPEALAAFLEACRARGLNLAQRPASDFGSVSQIIRTLLHLPADLAIEGVMLHGRSGIC